jgi:hypothetical protein
MFLPTKGKAREEGASQFEYFGKYYENGIIGT